MKKLFQHSVFYVGISLLLITGCGGEAEEDQNPLSEEEQQVNILQAETLQKDSAVAQQQSLKLRSLGRVPNVDLAQDYAYYGFDVNQDYLVWFEGYMHTVFVYDLSNQRLKKIKLKEGRGPHEILQLMDLVISDDNISLVDFKNIKYIQLKPSGKFLKDRVPPSGIHPMRFRINAGYQVIMDPLNQQTLFFLRKGDNYIPIKLKNSTLIKEFKTPYEKEGYLTIHNKYLIHLVRYYPYIYVYDLEKKVLIKKIVFDESEVDGGGTRARSDGARMMYPPEKVDILSKDVANIPGVPGRIFLLAKGASDNRDYDLDTLYEYDFENEEFVGIHKLGVKATEITVNDNYLFVYSKEENKIFQYEIVLSN